MGRMETFNIRRRLR